MSTLYFDTETTGFFKKNTPLGAPEQAGMVQLGAILEDRFQEILWRGALLVKTGKEVGDGAFGVHGISKALVDRHGLEVDATLAIFDWLLAQANLVVGHNIQFDMNIMRASYATVERNTVHLELPETFCTMLAATDIVKAPHPNRSGNKWPKLTQCIKFFFDEEMVGAHDALADIDATRRVHHELMRRAMPEGTSL